MPKSDKGISLLALFFVLLICQPRMAAAYEITKLNNTPILGDFVLNQSKVEVRLNPGEAAVRSISIVNRAGTDINFSVEVEDFTASSKAGEIIDLLGGQAGKYSLKNFIKPEVSNFTLHQGEQMTLPISISIPADAQPGGLYGAVSVTAQGPLTTAASGNAVRVSTRLTSLFFVTVNGEIKQAGALQYFNSSNKLYWDSPIQFNYFYKNDGTTYVNPYGELKIYNLFGREVFGKHIEPYFVMPGAVRQQKESVNKPNLFGLYKATLRLNRGYADIIDQKSVYVFVLPVKYDVLALLVIIVLSWVIRKAIKARNKSRYYVANN